MGGVRNHAGADGILRRILPWIGRGETVERLDTLTRSDFGSVMLEVIRRRPPRETAAVPAPLVPLGTHSALGLVSQDQRFVVRGLAAAGDGSRANRADLAIGRGWADRGRGDRGYGPGLGRDRSRAVGRMRVLPRSVFHDQRARWRRGAGDRGRRLY
jgi:hypothetical protein